jgi:hypothetical protein
MNSVMPGVPPELKNSIAKDFRGLLTLLHDEFGLPMTSEYVYNICPACYHVYRNNRHGDSNDCTMCPDCQQPRFMDDNGKTKARKQVGIRSRNHSA